MPRPRHPASLAARLAAPFAAVLAVAAHAQLATDPVAAAESAYLTLAVGVVLVAAGAAAPRAALESLGGALLAVVAVWALPPGPARGAVAVAVAAGALAVAAVRWLPRSQGSGTLPAVPVLALAFGLQALLRGADLLAPGSALRAAALFVAFPLAGAFAVLALARHHGRGRALLAGAAVLLVGPGFRPATLAALLAMAAAPWLLARSRLAPGLFPDAVRAPVLRLPERARSILRPAVRAAAGVVLLAPFAWDWRAAALGLVAAVAAVPTAGRGRWAAAGLAAGVLVLAAALFLPGLPVRSPGEALSLAALVPLAVPALAFPERHRVPVAVAALLLALAAGWAGQVEGALAPAAALAALAVPRSGALLAVQGGWIAVLVGAGSLLAAYPWLREAPLPGTLALLGLAPDWPAALAVVAGAGLLAILAAVSARASATWRPERAAALAAGVVALAAVFLRLPAAGATPVEPPGLVLDADRPHWTAGPAEIDARRLPGGDGRVGAIVVDSSLANAAGLPRGAPVATLRFRDPGGAERVWVLRVGEETGEWAAGRPDLRAVRVPAPPSWTSWVAEGGGFFGRRYRSEYRLVEPAAPGRLELSLRRDLPEGVTLTVFHLELRP